MKKDSNMLSEYASTITEQLKNEVVERIPTMDEHNKLKHYMPHLSVIREDRSTTTLRVVYNGSATSKEFPLTLNDCLPKGPNLIPKLFDVLIRFRNNLIALTADIEKAFLMITC